MANNICLKKPIHNSRRTRICYLGLSRSPNSSGDPRIFNKQLSSLVESGYEVTALITGDGSPFLLNGILIKPMGWKGGLLKRWIYLWDVFYKGLMEQANCYFFGNFEILPVAIFLKVFTGARLVYDSMEHFPDAMRASRQVWRFMREPLAIIIDIFERLAAPFINLIIAADEPTGYRFRNKKNLEIIYNYPSLKVFDQRDEILENDLANRLNGYRVISYVGGLGTDRGMSEMIDAIDIVRCEYPNILLLLIGPWQYTKQRIEYEKRIERMGLNNVIEIIGYVRQEKLSNYLRISEMGLAPLEKSRKHEKNIATKQFDYMCSGIPVIASDLIPFRKYVGEENAGILVNTNDFRELANAIIFLLSNRELAIEMGKKGRNAIENKWNWESQHKKLLRAVKKSI